MRWGSIPCIMVMHKPTIITENKTCFKLMPFSFSLPLSSLKYPCSPHCLYCIRLLCQPPIKFQASQTAKSISCGSGQEQSTAITILFSKNPFSKTNIQRPREIWVMKLLYLLSQTPGLITAGEGRR